MLSCPVPFIPWEHGGGSGEGSGSEGGRSDGEGGAIKIFDKKNRSQKGLKRPAEPRGDKTNFVKKLFVKNVGPKRLQMVDPK